MSGEQRASRTFWVWNGWDSGGPREAVGLYTGEDGYWWFADLGQPGFGSSLAVGRGAFDDREACIRYHVEDARRSLRSSQERVERLAKMLEGVSA